MQLIITLVVGTGLFLFLGLIILMSIATILDVISPQTDKQKHMRDELWRMTGDPKDRP